MFLLQDVEPYSRVLHLATVPPRHQSKQNLSSNDSTSLWQLWATRLLAGNMWSSITGISHGLMTCLFSNTDSALKIGLMWTHNMVEPNCSFYIWVCCGFGETASCKRCLNMLDECGFCWWQPIDCSSLLCKQVDLG